MHLGHRTTTAFALSVFEQKITRHYRHQCAGNPVGRKNREHNRQRHRREQILGGAGQQQHREKYDANAKHGYQCRHDDLLGAVQNRLLQALAHRHVAMDVLDRDRGVVDQDADCKRQAAERHQVQRIAHRREHDDREQNGERNGSNDHQRRTPAAQEQQDQQPGQCRGHQAFNHYRTHRVRDEHRLVKQE